MLLGIVTIVSSAFTTGNAQSAQSDAAAAAGIPERCSTAALDFQTGCTPEINAAQKFFGVNTTGQASQRITNDQLTSYLAQAPVPSTV